MRNSKLGLRALGLALLVALGMMAFVGGAQAQTNLASTATNTEGEFQINLSPALLALIAGVQEGTGALLVPGRNLTILCETGAVTEGKILSNKLILAVVLFEKCLAFNLDESQHLPCLVLSAGETGDSVAAKVLAKPILHEALNYVLFEPDNLLNFVEVELHGEKCPLPLVNPVKGSIVAQVIVNDANPGLLTFSPAIQLLVADKLTFGGFPAYLDSSAEVGLGIPHAAGKLGVV